MFWAVRDGSSNGTVGDFWTTLTATAVSVDHAGVTAGVGVKTIQLLTRVTDQVVTQSPGPVTPTPAAPSAPQGLSVTVGDGQLTANWLTPAQAGTAAITDYKIEYRLATQQSWTTESDTSTALTRTLTGLTNGVQYDVRVAAVSTAGTSVYVSQLATPTAATSYIAPSICATSSPSSLPAAQGGEQLHPEELHPPQQVGGQPGLARHRRPEPDLDADSGRAPGDGDGRTAVRVGDHAAGLLVGHRQRCRPGHRQRWLVHEREQRDDAVRRLAHRASGRSTTRATPC